MKLDKGQNPETVRSQQAPFLEPFKQMFRPQHDTVQVSASGSRPADGTLLNFDSPYIEIWVNGAPAGYASVSFPVFDHTPVTF